MKKYLSVLVLIISIYMGAFSQSLVTNLDTRLYFGNIQSGTAGLSIGYEQLVPPKIAWGLGFSYLIPFSYSVDVELDPIEDGTMVSSTWCGVNIKPMDLRLYTKISIARDIRDTWFVYAYFDMAYNYSKIDIDVADYNRNKYYGPEDYSETSINIFLTVGAGFEFRFGKNALTLQPSMSFPPTHMTVGNYTTSVDNTMPSFLSFNLGYKKYLVKDFKKKFGKPERKRNKRRR